MIVSWDDGELNKGRDVRWIKAVNTEENVKKNS